MNEYRKAFCIVCSKQLISTHKPNLFRARIRFSSSRLGHGSCVSRMAFSSALSNRRHRTDGNVFSSSITNSNSILDSPGTSVHNASPSSGRSSVFAVFLLNYERFIRIFVTSIHSYASVNGQTDVAKASSPKTVIHKLLRTNIPARLTSIKRVKIAAVMILFFTLPRIVNSICSPE